MENGKLSIFGAAFLDGFSLAGFLAPLKRPGAPTRVFADESEYRADKAEQGITPEELKKAQRILIAAGFDVRPPKTGQTH
jgi:hypothetical protein